MKASEKGFTTGSASSAATKAALIKLISGNSPDSVSITLPDGKALEIPVTSVTECGCDNAYATVRKDAGGDYDVTHGAIIRADVIITQTPEIIITGGTGVGIVTKAGLPAAIGEYAINPTPRRMITGECEKILPSGKGAKVTISVPGGEKIAEKTHNARLGIIGGISIIGTTGIVEPKSLDAYKKSLALELDVMTAEGTDEITLVLGYVGEKYCCETLNMSVDSMIKIGDHVGFMILECAKRRVKKVLLAGHIGKIIKVAGGQFNTHVDFGDERISGMVNYAKRAGATREVIDAISEQTMTEAVVGIMKENGMESLFDSIAKDAAGQIIKLTGGAFEISVAVLSLDGAALGNYSE